MLQNQPEQEQLSAIKFPLLMLMILTAQGGSQLGEIYRTNCYPSSSRWTAWQMQNKLLPPQNEIASRDDTGGSILFGVSPLLSISQRNSFKSWWFCGTKIESFKKLIMGRLFGDCSLREHLRFDALHSRVAHYTAHRTSSPNLRLLRVFATAAKV